MITVNFLFCGETFFIKNQTTSSIVNEKKKDSKIKIKLINSMTIY